MRILHLGKFYPPAHGGMEVFLAALAEAQASGGAEVGVLVHAHDQPGDGKRSESAGVEVWRVPIWGSLLYTPLSPAYPLWLKRILGRFKPQILHLHLPNPSAFWALFLSAARRLPWVVHWHSDVLVSAQIDRRLSLAYRLYAPFEQAVLARARRIVVSSPSYLESSLALARWRDKCSVVPLALADSVASALATPMAGDSARWQKQGVRVLAVGRLTYYKGFEVLIRAAALCPEVQVAIVGEGERRAQLARLISDLGIAQRVKLLGGLSDHELQKLYRSADLFCLPSLERTEAFGVVLLEAMAAGKPIIASDIPGSGVGWVLQGNEAAMLVPPGDVTALSGALGKMSADSGRAGPSSTDTTSHMAKFQIKSVTSQLSEIYRAAANRP